MKKFITALTIAASVAVGYAAPSVKIRLPERFRALTDQQFDIRVEATEFGPNSTVSFTLDGSPVNFGTPVPSDLQSNVDADTTTNDKEWTFRNLSVLTAGVHTIVATVTDPDNGNATATYTQKIGVQDFSFTDARGRAIAKKNYILFIGDAMGTAYRDAGRIVAKSTGNRFREGFFDQLLSMDTMPASGMVMTYDIERIVPDSSPTASAWCTGNKTTDGTHGVFGDNDDFRYNAGSGGATIQSTKFYALNNPRIETLWEYLKRKYGYKTGIVSTADITDATPAGEGSHVQTRTLTYDIATQFLDGSINPGPAFDVILGGGREHFDLRNATNSGDTRNLVSEFQSAGFSYAHNRTELNAIRTGGTPPDKLLGLFFSVKSTTDAGLTSTGSETAEFNSTSGNMSVAYDKLGLTRPGDEGVQNLKGYTDQPMLDEMTDAAIKVLSKNNAPFILMVEGASIDKQSHSNWAAGCIWDVIELDKAVAVGRNFGTSNGTVKNTKSLVVVTADHDQSMSIVGMTDTNVSNSVLNTRSASVYPRTAAAYDSVNGSTTVNIAGGSNVGEVGGFPNYVESNYGTGGIANNWPGNSNRYKLAVGFRTGNHTGSSVPITADGPGALLFSGYFDQTDVFFKAAKVLSNDTSVLDEALSVRASKFSTIDPNYGQ
ncbi:MAG: alkaline phosphatase [Chthoniobacterales bacterium]